MHKQIEKTFKDKSVLKAEKKQARENKNELKQKIRQTKSTIYISPELKNGNTASLLGVDTLKK